MYKKLIFSKPVKSKLQKSNNLHGLTSFGGLGIYMDVLHDLGLVREMKWFANKQKGYGDDVICQAVILMQTAGATCFSDWETMLADDGFMRLFPFPMSVDTIERYFRRLNLVELTAGKTKQGRSGYSLKLERLNKRLINRAYKSHGKPKTITLDIDATLMRSYNQEALYCYQEFKAYQPIVVYSPELDMVLAHEFRDGNVYAGWGYQRLIKRCIELFPKGTEFIVRSDSAGYENVFMDWLNEQGIRYYISATQTKAMQARIQHIEDDSEWKPLIIDGYPRVHEACYLYHGSSFSAQGQLKSRMRERDYIVTRKPKKEATLFEKYTYKVVATNDLENDISTILKTHWQRCGTVEYVNEQIKNQCGLHRMPSKEFKVNAAWFSFGCITHNLIRFVQNNLLPEEYRNKEIKTLRFKLIRSTAIIVKRSRYLITRISDRNPLYEIYCRARLRLATLNF